MNSKSINMTEGAVAPQLLRLTAPMVLGILAFMSVNLVDTFFVAQLGVDPLAAMSFTFPVVFCIASLAIGLGAGTSSVVARALGAGDEQRTAQLVRDCLLLCAVISLIVTGVGLPLLEPLFLLLGAEPETLPLISAYMVPWFYSSFLIIAPMVVTAVMRAAGNSGLSAKLMIVTAGVNLILDPLLIFGLFGFPRLELQGAAIASILARFVGVLIAIKPLLAMLRAAPAFEWRETLKSWRAILHVGLPAMGTNLIIPVASAVVVYLVAQYGEEAVAGMGVATRVEPIALICFFALSSIIGPFCGQNLGANNFDRIREAFRVITTFAIVSSTAMAVIFWLFAPWIVHQFTDDGEVARVAVEYLVWVPISYGMYGVVMSINAAFNGLGKPMPAMVVSIFRVVVVYLPLALLLQSQLELTGLFIATTVSNLLMGVVGLYWLHRHILQLEHNENSAARVEP